jgi:hypothetical protein
MEAETCRKRVRDGEARQRAAASLRTSQVTRSSVPRGFESVNLDPA